MEPVGLKKVNEECIETSKKFSRHIRRKNEGKSWLSLRIEGKMKKKKSCRKRNTAKWLYCKESTSAWLKVNVTEVTR